MKHTVIPTVNAYILNGNKIMLSRRANTGWMDGHLCPPGGHVEIGETPKVALIREMREELGVEVDKDDFEFACIAVRNVPVGETVAFSFIIRNKDYIYRNAEPGKCTELTWVNVHNLPSDVIEQFAQIISKGIVGKQSYIEVGY